jgi:hypothetical protein
MIAVNPDEEKKYIVKDERDLEPKEQTIFKVKTLSVTEAANLQDNAAHVVYGKSKGEDTKMAISSGSQALEALRKGLVGWENFYGSDGKEVEFKSKNGKAFNASLSLIPQKYRLEIANFIIEGNNLDEEDTKN